MGRITSLILDYAEGDPPVDASGPPSLDAVIILLHIKKLLGRVQHIDDVELANVRAYVDTAVECIESWKT